MGLASVLARRASTVVPALVIGAMTAACWAAPDPDMGVQVFCGLPESPLCPPGEFQLEIGTRAWRLNEDGGVAIIPSGDAQPVRLVDVASCHLLLSFTADAGHRYTVRIGAADSATYRDLVGTDEGFNYGPSMPEAEISSCP